MNIALITARGGSKGLKRKNILNLNGKPLIAWTIEAALMCDFIDVCYVTTEDQEIAEVSKKYGATVINRPDSLAQDNSTSEQVIAHAIDEFTLMDADPLNIVLLQPTSPLRTSDHISQALDVFNEKKAHCVISVFEPKHCAAKAYKIDALGRLTGMLSASAPYAPRQQLPETFLPNGAIYWFSVDAYKQHNQIPRENVYPYIMSEQDSIDIDTIDDFNQIEKIIRGRHEAWF